MEAQSQQETMSGVGVCQAETLSSQHDSEDSTSTHQDLESTDELDDDHLNSYLPEPPEEPLPSDCCGTGCSPCVMDLYQEEKEAWLRLKAMSPRERVEWRRTVTAGRRDPPASAGCPVALSPVEYREFAVGGVRQVSRDSFVFSFRLPVGHRLGLQVGQHAVLRVREPTGHSLTRQYTPVSPLDQKDSFDVLIKVYENGRMSRYVREWTAGTKAQWRGPFGDFTYTPNKYKRVTMLACGTGIAPMVQVIRAIVENEGENTFVHLLYGCRTQHDILLKQALDHFSSYWNFTVLYSLSKSSEQSLREAKGSMKYRDRVHFSRIDYQLVQREVPSEGKGNVVLICGTKSFDKDMINHLTKAGYTKEMYFKF